MNQNPCSQERTNLLTYGTAVRQEKVPKKRGKGDGKGVSNGERDSQQEGGKRIANKGKRGKNLT